MAIDLVPIQIAIVEDNTADVLLVREALNAHQIAFEMTHIKDGADAISTLCRNPPEGPAPDLILLDLNMPRIGGLEVLAAIRKNSALCAVPVIVLTSSPAPEEQQAARRLGVMHYVQKPADLFEFIEQVGGAIRDAIREK